MAAERVSAALTCRDVNDAAHWTARLAQADQAQCEALLNAMLAVGTAHPAAKARYHEGAGMYYVRFGWPFVPF
jgi:hypothetical protein